MKKIALINPPYRVVRHTLSPSFPLGLGYIKKYATIMDFYAIYMISQHQRKVMMNL